MDAITSLLIPFGALATSVWAFTEFAPRVLPGKNPIGRFTKATVAAVAGPVFGVAAWALGWVTMPGEPGFVVGLLGSAFAGFLATITAKAATDKVINPLTKKK